MKCPHCNGEGGNQGIACGSGHCRTGFFKCSTCKGTGEIDQSRMNKIELGKAMREDRIKHGLSQREEAKRLGIDVAMYSKIERGICDEPYTLLVG